ncbi:hypothetical protein RIF29_19949 [Crotalaria pallida]|uniref:Uncharacterized protein n=1 Tax=Crotalaria pallida TaxID=3830 RepID=A0AAN9F0T0_CROPI
MAVQHNGEDSTRLSLSFCKTSKFSHILALSDEDGYLNLFDTRRHFTGTTSFVENTVSATVMDVVYPLWAMSPSIDVASLNWVISSNMSTQNKNETMVICAHVCYSSLKDGLCDDAEVTIVKVG